MVADDIATREEKFARHRLLPAPQPCFYEGSNAGYSIMSACEKMQGLSLRPCLSPGLAEPTDECRYYCSRAAGEVVRKSSIIDGRLALPHTGMRTLSGTHVCLPSKSSQQCVA